MLISRKVMVTFIMRLVQMRNCEEIELTWTLFIGQLIGHVGGGGNGRRDPYYSQLQDSPY